jgi:hypothetical protein
MVSNKIKNMKQLLPLFLFLLPCLALAQYPSNGNQKITLGEQTTADGLVYRGVLADTGNITPRSDTSAYIILDTVNNRFFHYKRNTNVWSIAGGSDTSLIAYVNTYGTQTVNGAKTFTSSLTTTKLNVTDSIQANTGVYKINATTVGLNVDNTTPFRVTTGGNWGVYNDNPQNLLNTFSSSARGGVISNAYPILMFNEVGQSRFLFGLDANEAYLWGQASVKLRIATNNTEKLRIETNGDVGIGTFGATSPSEKLHVVGNARFTAVGAGAYANDLNITSTGVLTTASSDEKYKYNILPINYGLNTILQLKPVNFQWIEGEEEDLGFIAQDVAEIIPEAVDTNWNSDLLMRYESIIPILTKAIQEQQALIKALEQRIINLENK